LLISNAIIVNNTTRVIGFLNKSTTNLGGLLPEPNALPYATKNKIMNVDNHWLEVTLSKRLLIATIKSFTVEPTNSEVPLTTFEVASFAVFTKSLILYYLFRLKIEEDDTKIGKFILNNGNLLSGDIKGKTLIDLCRHLSGSLSSNLKSNGCSIAKGELNHNLSKRWEETDEERKKEVSDYLRCDVLGLCELYEKVNEPMFNKYNINLCSKLTTSSNAFDIWRDKFLKNDIFLSISFILK